MASVQGRAVTAPARILDVSELDQVFGGIDSCGSGNPRPFGPITFRPDPDPWHLIDPAHLVIVNLPPVQVVPVGGP